jgi:hypothetical protein
LGVEWISAAWLVALSISRAAACTFCIVVGCPPAC